MRVRRRSTGPGYPFAVAVTRELIVQAALEILDAYGLADLSMRRIGDALGVQAASIYWHYANKQSLLAGVSDAILAGISIGDGLACWAGSLRAALLAHRDGAEVVSATLATGLGTIDPAEPARTHLMASGIAAEDAGRAARVLVYFILGHVAAEQARQNLIDFEVLGADTQALDEQGFDLGVRVIIDGMSGLPTSK